MSDMRAEPSTSGSGASDIPSTAAPADVLKKIRNAWIAGLITASVTLLVTLLAVFGVVQLFGFDAWEFVDVVLILGLTYGIYRKSRVCAVFMVIYFVASKIMLFMQTGKPNGIVVTLIFLYYYCQGVAGTFAYHRHTKDVGATQQVS